MTTEQFTTAIEPIIEELDQSADPNDRMTARNLLIVKAAYLCEEAMLFAALTRDSAAAVRKQVRLKIRALQALTAEDGEST